MEPPITPEAMALRKLRDKRQISRDKLATMVKTSRGQIQKLEEGDRKLTLQWLRKIVPKLGVSLDDFLTFVQTERLPGEEMVSVPEYDVRVAAGDGFHIADETRRDIWNFSHRYLTEELRLPTRIT